MTEVSPPLIWPLLALLMGGNFFPYIQPEFPLLQSLPVASCHFLLYSSEKILSLSFVFLKWAMAKSKQITPVFFRQNKPSSLLPIMSCILIPRTSLWPCVWTLQFINILPVSVNPKLVPKLQMCWAGEHSRSLQGLAMLCASQFSRNSVIFCCWV